ncbi:MAG TPA: hypothetical protein VIK55_05860 [Paludibacter sp.]
MDNYPISSNSLEKFFYINGNHLGQQYKDHLSGYKTWDQKKHASEWVLFPENIGSYLSLDETSLSNGELYTVLTAGPFSSFRCIWAEKRSGLIRNNPRVKIQQQNMSPKNPDSDRLEKKTHIRLMGLEKKLLSNRSKREGFLTLRDFCSAKLLKKTEIKKIEVGRSLSLVSVKRIMNCTK